MNLSFLGDALDHWKGSLFESLQQADVLREFAVDAMASDWQAWQRKDRILFARLLRIQESQLIQHAGNLSNRQQYFDEITHAGDLFLDPDTGIATGRVKRIIQYVQPTEIARLLHGSDRILAVYQHVRARHVSVRVDAVSQAIRSAVGDCQWTSYESGTVAMIFLSRSRRRTAAVAAHFAKLLGRHSVGRIRPSTSKV